MTKKTDRRFLALDRTIHDPSRLLILTALYNVPRMEYVRLQKDWNFTQGNLAGHLIKLEKAGYVAIEKTYKGKRPQTWCSITRKAREAIHAYAELLSAICEKPNP
jgi:DNA-binding MarR family transcriptional regulator